MSDRPRPAVAAEPVISGRYVMFWAGQECGGERWEIARREDGYVIVGEQEITPPHPYPNRQEYRATLTNDWRPTGLDVIWTVGARRIVATHRAAGDQWRVQIDSGDQVREQHGDFPSFCEVEFTTHLFNLAILARRDFQLGGEHEFPVLRIGPPLMAVTPERMLYRCVEIGSHDTPLGAVRAKRYICFLPSEGEQQGYTFWADEEGFVLESYEGHDLGRPWMRLVELNRGA